MPREVHRFKYTDFVYAEDASFETTPYFERFIEIVYDDLEIETKLFTDASFRRQMPFPREYGIHSGVIDTSPNDDNPKKARKIFIGDDYFVLYFRNYIIISLQRVNDCKINIKTHNECQEIIEGNGKSQSETGAASAASASSAQQLDVAPPPKARFARIRAFVARMTHCCKICPGN
ncbi:MAG: hypothetical protein M0R33_18915 [Methylomonas sp.]|jgi:hypothetical protein|uniref:hypothetical protein n=1 Tax=Methylomonas sp. TaxID=418 RepID=UPI0025E25247|nr:hypothetical protein [Methylomonas sp.]MCK9608517.1 hypothetical protein [Methylomonas sp.]